MSDESGNEDQWLYGDSINPEPPENLNANESKDNSSDIPTQSGIQDGAMEVSEEQVGSTVEPVPVPGVDNPTPNDSSALEEGQIEAEDAADGGTTSAADLLNGDDSDSDDDVNVVIGDIKPSTTYASLNIKRGGLLTSTTGSGDKMKTPGKFSIEEFEAIGTINGMPAHEFNLDQLEDKPWRKPGADITDYFNYGFNEDTWRSYCERQKRIRVHESGVGLAQLGSTAGRGVIPVSITNDNSKYSTWDQAGMCFGPKKAGPPPGRRYAGTIDVIGGGGLASRRGLDKTPPKENVIQVMTADRRGDYRGGGRNFPDMSMPPPPAGMPPPFDLPPPPHGVMPPHGMPGPPHGMPGPPHGMPGGPPHMPPSFPPPPHMDPYGGEFYPPPDVDPYYHSYEPTQDCQWDPTWAPTSLAMPSSDVKVLTPGPVAMLTPTPVPPPTAKVASKAVVPQPQAEAGNQDSQDAVSPRTPARGDGDRDTPTMALGVLIKQEPKDDEGRKDRSKDRDRSEKHKERSHRHRSRSRSTERRSRRHKSRSRSPGGHRTHRKKKSRRSEREKSKEESE